MENITMSFHYDLKNFKAHIIYSVSMAILAVFKPSKLCKTQFRYHIFLQIDTRSQYFQWCKKIK